MKILTVLVAVVIVACVFFGGSFVYDAYFVAPGPAAQDTVLTVAPGESVSEIARNLENSRVIKSPFTFRLYVKLAGKSGTLQAGQFDLKTGMSYAAIVDTLTQSGAVEVEITIPEGYTIKQIGETVRAAISTISEEDWNAASADLEGHLFPDTYRFFADATAQDIVDKMRATFDEKVPVITPDQLILASIIEREVQDPEDMKLVADIFYKRLEIGMALQADSTLTYITGLESAEMTTDDLALDSLYNTYLYPGLPPGPISNPGLNAIAAALDPKPNPYYYFLTTDEGEVIYAETFEQHVANKNEHLR